MVSTSLVAGDHDGLGDRHARLLGQTLEARLVVEAREIAERAGEHPDTLGEIALACGEVEDLLEGGDDDLDLVRVDERRHLGDEGVGGEARRRGHEVTGGEP